MEDKLFTRQEVEELMEISVETTDEEVGRSQNFRIITNNFKDLIYSHN